MAIRRAGGSCEMTASLQRREPGNTEMFTWKMLPSSAVKTMTENTSLCVIAICKV
jgi:hypothetical protein